MSHTLGNSISTGRRYKCEENNEKSLLGSIKPALSKSKGKVGILRPKLLKMEIMTHRLEILVPEVSKGPQRQKVD